MGGSPTLSFLPGVGPGEWLVILAVILIAVGPKRLPEIARKIGRTLEKFRRAADDFRRQIERMDDSTGGSPPVLPPVPPVPPPSREPDA